MKSSIITDLLVHDRNWRVTHRGWKPGKQPAKKGSLSGNTLPPFWSIQGTWRAGTASQTDWRLGILSWKDDNSSRVKEEVVVGGGGGHGTGGWPDISTVLETASSSAVVVWGRVGVGILYFIVTLLSRCAVPFCQGERGLILSLCCYRIQIACDSYYSSHTESWTLLMIILASLEELGFSCVKFLWNLRAKRLFIGCFWLCHCHVLSVSCF